MLDNRSRNCLSYWFPRLADAGIPVPRTEIVTTASNLIQLVDGEKPDGYDAFVGALTDAVNRIGTPCFLRTGQTSGKHRWRDTCYLASVGALPQHIAALVEWSALVDIMGLPTDTWVVRELLPVDAITTLPRYHEMPLVQEVRGFVEGGVMVCEHNYWPEGAIEQGYGGSDSAKLANIVYQSKTLSNSDRLAINALLDRVATLFADDGAWSVDVLKTRRGFFVTDMAEAHASYHVPECANAKRAWAQPAKTA